MRDHQALASGHAPASGKRIAPRCDALDQARRHAAHDIAFAFERSPALAREAAEGRTGPASRAMAEEARVRASPKLRADRFVEQWQGLARERGGTRTGPVAERMAGMVEGVRRDSALAKALEGRAPELAITLERGRSIDRTLERSIGIGPRARSRVDPVTNAR